VSKNMAINDTTHNATAADGIVSAFGSTDAADKRMADHVDRENKKMQQKAEESQIDK
jgi:hypothetical protein